MDPSLDWQLTPLHIAHVIMTAHPSSMKPRASHSWTTQPSTQLLGRLCVQLWFDRPGPRLTSCFPPVLQPGLVPASQTVSDPTCTLGLMPTWTSSDVLKHRRDKTWKIWESMSQAGTPSNPCILFLLPCSYLSLYWSQPSVLIKCQFECAWVSVSQCSLW